MRKFLVSVIGGHKCDEETARLAREAGKIIASSGAVVVTGGLGGVMKAVSAGAKETGGETIGIIPGEKAQDANQFVDIVITTGMGYSRNTIVAGTADIVLAFPGEYGTLSEIGFALAGKKKVYGFGSWEIDEVQKLDSIDEFKEILKKEMNSK